MTYSSGMFKKESDDLYDAQLNKYMNLAKITDIKNRDKVLEIGCGWGGFSCFLAKKFFSRCNSNNYIKKTI